MSNEEEDEFEPIPELTDDPCDCIWGHDVTKHGVRPENTPAENTAALRALIEKTYGAD